MTWWRSGPKTISLVGYGLDYRQLYRNLPYVGVLRPEIFRG